MAASEYMYPLTAPPYSFVGKRPVAVLFGDGRVDVKSWREVYAAVIGRCNQDAGSHDRLMYLRNKTAGKVRVFLSDTPDGMTRPHKIGDDLYGETHYGAATLMHILLNRILAHTGFDYSNISVALRG